MNTGRKVLDMVGLTAVRRYETGQGRVFHFLGWGRTITRTGQTRKGHTRKGKENVIQKIAHRINQKATGIIMVTKLKVL